jgi:hypothetical protein
LSEEWIKNKKNLRDQAVKTSRWKTITSQTPRSRSKCRISTNQMTNETKISTSSEIPPRCLQDPTPKEITIKVPFSI